MPSIRVLFFCLLAFIMGFAGAQIKYEPNTNTISCPKPGGSYCASSSLMGPTMISCASSDSAKIRSCNIQLTGLLPEGYEQTAVCYQTSPNAGDAVCAFNGTGYTLSGSKIDLPETIICDDAEPPMDDDEDYENDSDLEERPFLDDTDEITMLTLAETISSASLSPPASLSPTSPLPTRICSNPWSSDPTSAPTSATTTTDFMLPAPMYFVATSSRFHTVSKSALPSGIKLDASGVPYTPVTETITLLANTTTVFLTMTSSLPATGVHAISGTATAPVESMNMAVSDRVRKLGGVVVISGLAWVLGNGF